MIRPPPKSPLFPYPPLFRSAPQSGKMPVATIGTPNPPLTFTMKKGGAGPTGALAGVNAKDLQAELAAADRSEEHTSELQSRLHLVCRLLLEKKKKTQCHGHN